MFYVFAHVLHVGFLQTNSFTKTASSSSDEVFKKNKTELRFVVKDPFEK